MYKEVVISKLLFTLVGKPNCGKGTNARLLATRFGIPSLGTGDVCRDEEAKNSIHWRKSKEHMELSNTNLWPTNVLLEAFMVQANDMLLKGTCILDGFLRNADQIMPLVHMAQIHEIDRIVVVDVNASDELCISRAEKRKRPDDINIHKRLEDFTRYTKPAIDHFLSHAEVVNFDRVTFNADLGNDNKKYTNEFIRGVGLTYHLPVAPAQK